jgi:UDP-D-galactose:(glucosyl)LPS alpha-1,6-D-galactosyltransferase
MEILVVVGTLSGLGGIESCVRMLAEEAAAVGDLVRVLALCPSIADARWHQGLLYTEVAKGPTSLKWQMIRGLPAVVDACKAHRPDVVIAIYGSSIPLVRLGLFLAKLRRPVMAWLHFSTAHKQRTSLLRYAHGHLCISSQIAASVKQVDGVAADSVHLVYNGVRTDGVAPLPRPVGGPLRLVHAGRLMVGRQKCTDALLRALARVEGDWRLELVGAGEAEDDGPALRALAERLGITDRLSWRGWQADPWRAIETADLLVLCSAFEGFPMVLIEAMAHGVPCLSSDCPSGPSEIIRPGGNGWLYPVGDEDALAQRLQSLVDDRSLLPSVDAVRASVARFSSGKMFRRIRQAIDATIGRFGRSRAA